MRTIKMPEHTPAPTPSRAVYGFAMFLSFRLFFILYLIWAFIPEDFFRKLGVTCLPQRYWAVAVPIFLLTVLTIFAFVIYPSLGFLMTADINDLRTVKDRVGNESKTRNAALLGTPKHLSQECSCKNKDTCFKEFYDSFEVDPSGQPIPVIRDLNIWDVNRHLYLR